MIQQLIYKFKNLPTQDIIKFFIIFYVIGFAGFIFGPTKPLFIAITPIALLLCFFLILYFEKTFWNNKTPIILISIFLLGYFVEVAGVNTGCIFGEYWYGTALGPKLWKTPLMIGVNWVMLTYISASVVVKYVSNTVARISLAALLMLLYDIVLEQSAPQLDMWYWSQNVIPLQNYIAWFSIAIIFQMILVFSKIEVANRFAKVLLICQFLFFILLFVYHSFII